MTSLAEPTLASPTTAPLADRFVGRRYLQLVLVLGTLTAIGPLTIDMYLPALPQLREEMAATDSQTQLTITGLLIGLGLGQLLVGPLSDAVGRRRPLLVGLTLHAVMSLLCAVAPSITMLTLTRTLQGLAGAAVAVVAMAVVRDLFAGVKAAQLLSRLTLVVGVAPILAPSLGSALLTFTSWRGIFVALSLIAVAMLVLAFLALPETLPLERRQSGTVRGSLRSYAGLFGDRLFVVMVLVAGLVFATLFAYISGAPFVLQELYGLTPAEFGVAFSANALGLVAMTQVNPLLLKRYSPVEILLGSVTVGVVAALALLVTTATGLGGMVGFLVPLWFILSAAGLAFPNAPAIALNRHGNTAGTAAAVLGASQFLVGGLIAPLVGVLADGTPMPMAAVMVGTTALSLGLLLAARRGLSSYSYA